MAVVRGRRSGFQPGRLEGIGLSAMVPLSAAATWVVPRMGGRGRFDAPVRSLRPLLWAYGPLRLSPANEISRCGSSRRARSSPRTVECTAVSKISGGGDKTVAPFGVGYRFPPLVYTYSARALPGPICSSSQAAILRVSSSA
jgi:hypothetical protein